MIPRYYLRIHARTSEDTLLPWEKEYQIKTTATGLYRRIRASAEPARDRIGLDQTHETRQSWPGIPARRTARGNTECNRQCRSPMTASLSRARSWSVAMRRGGDGLRPDVYPRCTCRVPRMTCGLPRGRWVRRPLQEAAGQKSRVQFWHPTGSHPRRRDQPRAPRPLRPRRPRRRRLRPRRAADRARHGRGHRAGANSSATSASSRRGRPPPQPPDSGGGGNDPAALRPQGRQVSRPRRADLDINRTASAETSRPCCHVQLFSLVWYREMPELSSCAVSGIRGGLRIPRPSGTYRHVRASTGAACQA